MGKNPLDILLRATHELGVALEMSYDGPELRELWSEALEVLEDAAELFRSHGISIPPVLENVIRLAN